MLGERGHYRARVIPCSVAQVFPMTDELIRNSLRRHWPILRNPRATYSLALNYTLRCRVTDTRTANSRCCVSARRLDDRGPSRIVQESAAVGGLPTFNNPVA